MALPATIRRFRLDISDVDRGVYEVIEERVAQHPSETDEFLVARVLAFALEQASGLAFGRGIGVPDDPALAVTDLQGRVVHWIDIGAPSGDRLHKAAKLAEQVTVYAHRRPELLLADLNQRTLHKADELRIVGLPQDLVDALAARLDRKNEWAILRTEGTLFVTIGDATFDGPLTPYRLG